MVASRATTSIISKVLPVGNPDTGWKPMLHYTVAWWMWVRGTPAQEAFREIARHSGEQCSIRAPDPLGEDTGSQGSEMRRF